MREVPHKPLDEIVSEVGRYPMEAFIFIQECIGQAAERVHGKMSKPESDIAKWMAGNNVSPDELEKRWSLGDLPPQVMNAIREVGGTENLNRHVSGQQLCQAIREVALERWGLMARGVLRRWNIHRTEDIGIIVFALVENGWLSKQPDDTIHDFEDVYSFDAAFDRSYRIS